MARKPMKAVDQLIEHLKCKGVGFTIISESEAKQHLDKHNNYFKLTSYRKNYTKKTTGINEGQYENLEFAYLIELARLDTEIRHLLLQMTLDIEHFLKVALIKAVEDRMTEIGDEDGYEIIKGFLTADDKQSSSDRSSAMYKRNSSFSRKISQNKNPYCGGLIQNYSDEMPVWAFVELISFGDLRDLLDYYSQKIEWDLPVDIMSIDRVRQIRNACAHGNGIINDLRSSKSTGDNKKYISDAPIYITNFVKNAGVNESSRKKKLSNQRISQIVHLLYVYDILVTSTHTRNRRLTELKNLVNIRCLQNKEYFKQNQLLSSTYDFFNKIINYIN